MRDLTVGLQSQYLLWQVEMPQWVVCAGISVWPNTQFAALVKIKKGLDARMQKLHA